MKRILKRVFTVQVSLVLIATLFLIIGVPAAHATVETGWPVSQPNTPRNANDIFIDFEDGIEGIEIESSNPNLKFTTTNGLNWRYGDIRTGSYNVYPYGTHAYECRGNFFAWLGVTGNAGQIDFPGGAATYCSVLVSTYSGVVIDAYNSDNELISTSGWAGSNINTRTFTRLTVDAPAGDYISYVIFHDTGNYWLIDDLCTDAKPAVIPVPGRSIGDHSDKFDIVFVPDTDYGSPQDIDTWLPTFIDHINHQIDDRLGAVAPVSGHLDEFNFYYTRMQGIASSLTLPEDLTKISTFADVYVMFHTTPFGDQTVGKVYSAEGSLTDSEQGRSFIHESGHGIFRVADEYDDTTPPYTNYFQANPYPNIWETRAVGRTDAAGEYAVPIHDEILGVGDGTKVQFGPIANGNSPNAANTFFADTDIDGDVDTSDVRVYLDGIRQETSTYGINPGNGIVTFNSAPPAGASVTIDYSYVKDEDWNPIQVQRFTVVQGDWWKLGTTPYIMEDGSHFANGWGKPGARRIQWFLDQYPDGSATAAASPQTEKSIWLNLELSTEGFHLIDDSYIIESPPDYLPGTYDFTAKVFSTSGELLGEYGFGDPRRVMAEQGYEGPTWLDSANFQLILQYFNSGARVDVTESATGSVELSIDISKYVYAFDVHDVAVTSVTSSKTVVGQGFSTSVNVTVANQGDYTEVFNVTAYANTTVIGQGFNETGLAGYWKFDEGSGTTANDGSDNGNNGAIYGATWVDGKYGKALNFDGVDDYVSVPDSDLWHFGVNDFSIGFWVYFNSLTMDKHQLIGQSNGGNIQDKWFIAFNFSSHPNCLVFEVCITGEGTDRWISFPWTPSTDIWYYTALVRSGTDWYLYVNGVQEGPTQTSNINIPNVASTLKIGSDGELWNFHDGLMDEVEIYSRSLSPEEVWAQYAQSYATKLVTLGSGASATLTFAWNTTGFDYGNYTIWAYAWPVQNETNTADNTFVDGFMMVTIPGDVNGDFIVDILDAVRLAGHYNEHVPWPHPQIDPNIDINNDGFIDIFDAIILANHYNQHYP